MEFKFSSNIFKNTPEDLEKVYGDNYDANKNYPNFTGTMTIPRKQLGALAEYLHWALKTDLKVDSYLDDIVVPVKVSGWQKESKSGKKFLSLSYAPDYKTMMAAKEAKESSVDNSAEDLAKVTNGTVVKAEEKQEQADIF